MPEREAICWEVLDPADKGLEQARLLYEATQPADERIPWEWIAGAVAGRSSWRPGRRAPHLLLAAPSPRRNANPIAFGHGIHLPQYGGYMTYLGVAERQRGRRVGARLMNALTRLLWADATCSNEPLPFVVWESRPPGPAPGPEEEKIWRARLRLFERVGAFWVDGVELLVPNFMRRNAAPIPLQLFVLPVEAGPEELGPDALRALTAGLLRGVYRQDEGSSLWARALPAGARPRLRPASEALPVRAPGD